MKIKWERSKPEEVNEKSWRRQQITATLRKKLKILGVWRLVDFVR